MSKNYTLRTTLFSLLAATCLSGAAFADDAILHPVQSGDTVYVTGGIGDGEKDALEVAKKDYNLHIMSATTTGEFISDSQIVITNKAGEEVINAVSGPIFYAKLPAGTYTVASTDEGITKKQKVTISAGHPAHVHFAWKMD